jgi:SAM-dependent methyltransferase
MAARQHNDIWHEGYKIPWDDPAFSKRMLGLHLAQDHDLASRRLEWIDRQVEWIHRTLLGQRPATILDLGCGPGFYSHRLTARGHDCRGIDFGPASIEYAQRHNGAGSRGEFVLGDIRQMTFGGPYDLAMLLYGEMNVFSPAEIGKILRQAQASLATRRGTLIVEYQTPEAVERSGHGEPSEERLDSGLFSDRPHRCRTECEWIPGQQASIQTFTITDAETGAQQIYRSTTKAWSPGELVSLLVAAGFRSVQPRPDWPGNTDAMELWSADV